MQRTPEELLVVMDSVARYLRQLADQVDALARERRMDPFLAGAARHGFESAAMDLEMRRPAP